MTRRRSSTTRRRPRTPSRRVLAIRAPRRATVVIAAILYITGLFGYLGWFALGPDLSFGLMTLAATLLLLGALLRDL